MDEAQSNNYWIIIPPQVAGLDDLQNGAKLVYGRIFALSQKSGLCWARNQHIAQGTGLTAKTVSEYVRELAKRNLIRVKITRDESTQEVIDRKIWLNLFTTPLQPELDTPPQSELGTLPNQDWKKEKNNNTIIKKKENHEEKKEVTTNSSFVDSSVEAEQRTSKNSLTACTDLELWTIAKSKNLRLEDVKFKHKQIMDMIADGEFQQRYKKHKTVYRTLQKWLDMSVERGYIQECNEIEAMIRDNQHPDIQAQVKWATEQAKKRGDV